MFPDNSIIFILTLFNSWKMEHFGRNFSSLFSFLSANSTEVSNKIVHILPANSKRICPLLTSACSLVWEVFRRYWWPLSLLRVLYLSCKLYMSTNLQLKRKQERKIKHFTGTSSGAVNKRSVTVLLFWVKWKRPQYFYYKMESRRSSEGMCNYGCLQMPHCWHDSPIGLSKLALVDCM